MVETRAGSADAAIARLPAAAELVEVARTAMREAGGLPSDPGLARQKRREAASMALDRWAPDIDAMTDLAGAAKFLGLKSAVSLRQNKFRTRADGTPAWPDPDDSFGVVGRGRSDVWKLRTIVIHRAESPGRGGPKVPPWERQEEEPPGVG